MSESFWCMVSRATGPQGQESKPCKEQCEYCASKAMGAEARVQTICTKVDIENNVITFETQAS